MKNDGNETESDKYNEARKSAVFIAEALKSVSKCKICNTPIHKNSISIDHKEKKKDGGKATIKNGQLTHPFCNTAIKN